MARQEKPIKRCFKPTRTKAELDAFIERDRQAQGLGEYKPSKEALEARKRLITLLHGKPKEEEK